MPKILITGSNGLLGQKILESAFYHPDFKFIATSRSSDRFQDRKHHIFEQMDITDSKSVEICFEKFLPEIVIHTAAMTLPDACELHKDECWNVNVEGTRKIAEACQKYAAHLIHLSTDFIFDGQNGPYREDDLPHPVNHYGKSKWEAEKIVQAGSIPAAIVRTVVVYGAASFMARPNLVLNVKNKLERKEKVWIAKDQYRTPTLAEDLAAGCLTIARQKSRGIYHLAGAQMISIYDFAVLTADVFGLDPSLIEPIETFQLQEAAQRPPRTGLIIEKAKKELNYRPHSLREGLEMLKNQIKK